MPDRMRWERNLPDFRKFHEHLAKELEAVKNRFRALIHHWPTDGAYKEAILRAVLLRHLPVTVFVGSGFVVDREAASTQMDVLIVDRAAPTLFKDGDGIVVTPTAVRAAIEVKTTLKLIEIPAALKNLAKVAAVCGQGPQRPPVWTGLFEYQGSVQDQNEILKSLRDAYLFEGTAVNCVALGQAHFIRHWPGIERVLPPGPDGARHVWRSYEVPRGLAPAYFLGNLVSACSRQQDSESYAWFPLAGEGKEAFSQFQIGPAAEDVPVQMR